MNISRVRNSNYNTNFSARLSEKSENDIKKYLPDADIENFKKRISTENDDTIEFDIISKPYPRQWAGYNTPCVWAKTKLGKTKQSYLYDYSVLDDGNIAKYIKSVFSSLLLLKIIKKEEQYLKDEIRTKEQSILSELKEKKQKLNEELKEIEEKIKILSADN